LKDSIYYLAAYSGSTIKKAAYNLEKRGVSWAKKY
jgi:hypothetical protein